MARGLNQLDETHEDLNELIKEQGFIGKLNGLLDQRERILQTVIQRINPQINS